MIALASPDVSILRAAQMTGTEADELQDSLSLAESTNQPLVDTILDHGVVDEEPFLKGLSDEVGMDWIENPDPETEETAALKRVFSAQMGIRHRVMPIRVEFHENGDQEPEVERLHLAVYDPFQYQQRQAIQKAVDCPIHWVMTSRKKLIGSLQDFYGVGADTFEELLANRDMDGDAIDLREDVNVIDDEDEEASVVKFVNQILREALSQRATDIHVEPLSNDLRIRYRIDGVLRSVPVPENIKSLQSSVIARLKVMSRLDIAEKRLPQDGRIHLKLDGNPIDVRVATIPGVEGENVSLRLLGQEQFTMDRLQMLPDIRENIDDLLTKPNGVIMVTGPTGCGKSTSLYCFLSVLNLESRRIVTIEDPVENKLEGLIQIAVRPEINLTFANGLRSILRGDPNVIMVGEIRDLETAEIAIRAALTGHLVLSTLHTNDAIGGISRLIDMGVEPFLVTAAVRAFMAQRLVRRLCHKCRKPAEYPEEYLRSSGVPAEIWDKVYSADPHGCESCRHTGYLGRLAVYEICNFTPKIQELIVSRASSKDLQRQAMLEGFRTMREYGWEKVASGDTTIEEVLSATDTSDRDD